MNVVRYKCRGYVVNEKNLCKESCFVEYDETSADDGCMPEHCVFDGSEKDWDKVEDK